MPQLCLQISSQSPSLFSCADPLFVMMQQLKRSSQLLGNAFSSLKEVVRHQRGVHEDLQTLRRSRWKFNSPDQEWRPDVWYEPLNTIVKRISSPYRSLELYRTSGGGLNALFLHQQTGIQLRIESHELERAPSSAPYAATGIRSEIGDLYRPLSNAYSARTTLDIHRLWMWVTKTYEDAMLWNTLKKAAATEGLEIRAEDIIIPMPNSSHIFTIHPLKPKQNISPNNTEQSERASGEATSTAAISQATHSSGREVDATAPQLTSPSSSSSSSSSLSTEKTRKRKRILRDLCQNTRHAATTQSDSWIGKTRGEHGGAAALASSSFDSLTDGDSAAIDLKSDFDVALSQDLMLLTLKQATMIMQHGQHMDTTRFPIFPTRRVLHPTVHPIFTPSIATVHHFRQLLDLSRLLDELSYWLPRSSATSALHSHFEATSLATSSTLHISFGSLHLTFAINCGKFIISPTEELDEPIQFIQHLSHTFANYLIEASHQHVNALCGPHTATLIHSRALSFPLGISHPLSHSKAANPGSPSNSITTTSHVSMELPYGSPFGLIPTLVIHSRIPGMPSSTSSKWALEKDIWFELPGSNFAEKLTSLIMSCR